MKTSSIVKLILGIGPAAVGAGGLFYLFNKDEEDTEESNQRSEKLQFDKEGFDTDSFDIKGYDSEGFDREDKTAGGGRS